MENKKIKVVWVCNFSNTTVRERLHFKKRLIHLLNKTKGISDLKDCGKWNTNAINEFKKFEDIKLHVISSHKRLSSAIEEFVEEGVNYHFFRPEEDSLRFVLKQKFFKSRKKPEYKKNSEIINSIIDKIKPDLIHLIGAENPQYSISALEMPKSTPLIVALQTLMIDPDFKDNYPISKEMYEFRSSIERKVLSRADYISCRGQKYIEILNREISPAPSILDLPLAVGESVEFKECDKIFDFVYFAKEIEKAVDWAIEAFALAHKRQPGITLNIVGGYSESSKQFLDKRLEELGVSDKVTFCGSLPTHEDVMEQIRKSRFAILPLKIDMVSGTIREAMANGLPVVTTITPATPKLNINRESVLLSEKGNFNDMAENMCRLINDKGLADKLQENAIKTLNERYDNSKIANEWRTQYYYVIREWKATKELQ